MELARREYFDLALIDLKMPGMDGKQVLETLKNEHKYIEVIILTGHGSEEDRKICMALGAFDYLQKPVDIDALSASIQKANEKIRRRQSTGS